MLKRIDIYSPVEPKISILVHVNYKTQLVFSVHLSTFFYKPNNIFASTK